ncbi:unnamed protein product [Boreogadus saida]
MRAAQQEARGANEVQQPCSEEEEEEEEEQEEAEAFLLLRSPCAALRGAKMAPSTARPQRRADPLLPTQLTLCSPPS